MVVRVVMVSMGMSTVSNFNQNGSKRAKMHTKKETK